MSTFEYTDVAIVDSRAVDEVYYNQNNGELAVDLKDKVYIYYNVPKARYEELVNASSVGRAFRKVRKEFAGEFLGHVDDLYYRRVSEPLVSATVGTPKALSYAEDAVVDGEAVTQEAELTTFSLTPSPSPDASTASEPEDTESEAFRAAVQFSIAGRDFTTNTNATTAAEARAELEEISEMLDIGVEPIALVVFLD